VERASPGGGPPVVLAAERDANQVSEGLLIQIAPGASRPPLVPGRNRESSSPAVIPSPAVILHSHTPTLPGGSPTFDGCGRRAGALFYR